ncbi:hypothetical protein MMYC01_204792 [Madurella mycetomatis]|uniref:DUF8035 domain-containing protein n=1 Tax=Madurella mycetomatis TaxID=100816 RepID=A0A175W2B5_9PEZI|nr:hypothetical protein MMYC01_204792 [Madurella mycetomatis]
MAYRPSAPDLPRPERWEKARYESERDRDRISEIRGRFEHDDDHVYVRRVSSRPPHRDDFPVGDERRFRPRDDDDDVVIRERRRVAYDDEPPQVMRRRHSPPDLRRRPSPPPDLGHSRVVIEKERYRSPSPSIAQRPTRLLRRQSSLDTFDRRPRGYHEREEYGPPARRDDYRMPPYVDMPMPRSKALPPPRVYAERDYYDEIQVSDPHRYGDDDFHAYPERVREREIIRTRRRARSRESRATSHSRRGRSRSSSRSSSSSSSGGTTLRSEYPKKGKTRIPARLVSKRALIDLGYPFVEEGKTIVVQKALGQHNIDDLLKLSDDYKKSELEVLAARSSAGEIVEERRTEVYQVPAALPPPQTSHVIVAANQPPPPPVEVVKTTMIRDVSPDRRSYTTASYDTTTSYDTSATPVIVDARPREVSERVPVGPLALVDHHHHHLRHTSRSRSRHRRGSRDSDDLRSEIRQLEKQLARRERRGSRGGGELVRAERLSTGELVLYEEEVEVLEEPARGGVRIERDKRGRMSISVPRYR